MKEGEKSASELFEAYGDSAMIFDLHEKAFDKMPFFEVGVAPVPDAVTRRAQSPVGFPPNLPSGSV